MQERKALEVMQHSSVASLHQRWAGRQDLNTVGGAVRGSPMSEASATPPPLPSVPPPGTDARSDLSGAHPESDSGDIPSVSDTEAKEGNTAISRTVNGLWQRNEPDNANSLSTSNLGSDTPDYGFSHHASAFQPVISQGSLNSAQSHAFTSSNKPVASVLPSVYQQSVISSGLDVQISTRANMKQADKLATSQPSSNSRELQGGHGSDKSNGVFKNKPSYPPKPKMVTFSDEIKTKEVKSVGGESSSPLSENTRHQGGDSSVRINGIDSNLSGECNSSHEEEPVDVGDNLITRSEDTFVKNSVKTLMSKFEQSSLSESSPPVPKHTGRAPIPSTAGQTGKPSGYKAPPPYPGHRNNSEMQPTRNPGNLQYQGPSATTQYSGPSSTAARPGINANFSVPVVSSPRMPGGSYHVSQSSIGSDQSGLSTISESSSTLEHLAAQSDTPAPFPTDLSQGYPGEHSLPESGRNWYESDSESLPSLPPGSPDSYPLRHAQIEDPNRSFDSCASDGPKLTPPTFAHGSKIMSMYQSRNGFNPNSFDPSSTFEPSFDNRPQSRAPITAYQGNTRHNISPIYQNLPANRNLPSFPTVNHTPSSIPANHSPPSMSGSRQLNGSATHTPPSANTSLHWSRSSNGPPAWSHGSQHGGNVVYHENPVGARYPNNMNSPESYSQNQRHPNESSPRFSVPHQTNNPLSSHMRGGPVLARQGYGENMAAVNHVDHMPSAGSAFRAAPPPYRPRQPMSTQHGHSNQPITSPRSSNPIMPHYGSGQPINSQHGVSSQFTMYNSEHSPVAVNPMSTGRITGLQTSQQAYRNEKHSPLNTSLHISKC